MIKRRLLIIALFLSLVGMPLAALASDITNAQYYGTVLVSNDSTASTNVATTANISTTNLISGNYLNATANNSVMRNSSGADVPFMPGYTPDGYPWCMWVPSIGANSYLNYILYTADSSGGELRYFPGAAGMETSDNASLEPSDNFTKEEKGWFDTTAGADKYIFVKEDAIRAHVSDSVDGEITAAFPAALFSDNFSSDVWTDVGTKIHVTTGSSRLDYTSERSADDERCFYDLTSISDTAWKLSYHWHPVSNTVIASQFWFGLGSIAENPNGTTADILAMYYTEGIPDTLKIIYLDGGAALLSGAITVVDGTDYYIDLERTSAIEVVLSVYSDAARTTHVAGSPVTQAIPATIVGLRYIQASNYDAAVGGPPQSIGWIDTLLLGPPFGGSVTATGVTSGEHIVAVSANGTNFWIEVDGVIEDLVALGGGTTPDNGNSWFVGTNDSMLYLEYSKIWIDGVLQQHIEWEYDNIFTDLSGNSHDATPSFRTASSDADVSANLTNFLPIAEAKAPDYALGEAPAFIDADALTGNVTGEFGTTPGVGTGTFPLSEVISTVAAATSTPPQLPLLIIAGFIILTASLAVSATLRKYGSGTLLFKIATIAIFMGIFVALANFAIDFWMIFVFLVIAIAIAFASRQLGWT